MEYSKFEMPEVIVHYILSLEKMAKSQIIKRMINNEDYDYLELFYALGKTTSLIHYSFYSALQSFIGVIDPDDPVLLDIFFSNESWESYRETFNNHIENKLGIENFLEYKLGIPEPQEKEKSQEKYYELQRDFQSRRRMLF